ncbi:MAG: organic solvent tolerance protein OstA [Spirochaetales bacterium]|nr:organic solvent tolerance protein OstA [Spirochaetales bacterium]
MILISLVFLSPLYSEESTFTFSADRTEAVLSQGKEKTVLSGNAVVKTNATVIEADRIELYGEDFRFVICSGDIRVTDEEQGFILNCRDLFFDRETEVTRVQGYTEMVDLKNSMVVKGSFFENHGKDNISIIQIGVRILKDDEDGAMVCRAEFARYSRDEDLLELSGMPRVNWKGDNYSASRISIDLETDEITMEGKVSGTMYTQEDE